MYPASHPARPGARASLRHLRARPDLLRQMPGLPGCTRRSGGSVISLSCARCRAACQTLRIVIVVVNRGGWDMRARVMAGIGSGIATIIVVLGVTGVAVQPSATPPTVRTVFAPLPVVAAGIFSVAYRPTPEVARGTV